MPDVSSSSTPTRDELVKGAQNLPELISLANQYDPELAQALQGKALIASKSVWGTAGTLVVSWIVTKYGLGWSPDTSAEVTGLLVLVVTGLLRIVTSGTITGIFKK